MADFPIGAVLALCFFVSLVAWLVLTFTNVMCTDLIGVCYKQAQPVGSPGACATCVAAPSGPAGPSGPSGVPSLNSPSYAPCTPSTPSGTPCSL